MLTHAGLVSPSIGFTTGIASIHLGWSLVLVRGYIYFKLFSQLFSQPDLNERNLQLNGSDLLEVFNDI